MKSILLLALSLCCYFTLGAQTIYYVKSGGSGAITGASWADAMDNVQNAIDKANIGDQVWVAQGKFYGNASSKFGIILKSGVALYGGFAGTESALKDRVPGHISQLLGDAVSGNNHNAAVSASDITLATVLDGFTIAPSQSPGPQCRGMYLSNVSTELKISHCIIDGNTTSTIYGNGYGTGIYMENNSLPIITNCTISNNKTTDYGGGVYVLNSSPVFINCKFINNQSNSTGGGAFNSGSSSIYSHCIFSGNISKGQSSSRGGALSFSGGGNSKINNCLITNNTANYGGAAISCFDAGLSVLNCTITGNPAVNQTGGAAILYSETGTNTLTIANSIIWNNVSTHAASDYLEIVGQNGSADPILGNNLIKYGQYGSMGDDPQFVDADNGNFQLLAASPAIDAGDNSAAGFVASDTDLIDHHRVINNVVDLGAYEALTDKIINNGESSFKGFSGTLDITGNPYENDLENTYK